VPSTRRRARLATLMVCVAASGCSLARKETIEPAPRDELTAHGGVDGVASWYGAEMGRRRTANGERFDPEALTAAHRSLPLGTRVQVTNLRNGRSVVVRVNDRGPFIRGRTLDVSRAAAQRLGMVGSGTARVRIAPLVASRSHTLASVSERAGLECRRTKAHAGKRRTLRGGQTCSRATRGAARTAVR